MLKDELDLDGRPNLNLASFVGTYMEKEAEALMVENLAKNMSDADEYPAMMAMQYVYSIPYYLFIVFLSCTKSFFESFTRQADLWLNGYPRAQVLTLEPSIVHVACRSLRTYGASRKVTERLVPRPQVLRRQFILEDWR